MSHRYGVPPANVKQCGPIPNSVKHRVMSLNFLAKVYASGCQVSLHIHVITTLCARGFMVCCAAAETKKDKVFAQGLNILSVEWYGSLGDFIAQHSPSQKISHHQLSIRLKLHKALLSYFEYLLSLNIKKAGVEVLKYGPIATYYLVCFI